jgi:hypothetical protein
MLLSSRIATGRFKSHDDFTFLLKSFAVPVPVPSL